MSAAPEPTPPHPDDLVQTNVPDHLLQFEVVATGCWLWTGDTMTGRAGLEYGRVYIPRPDGKKGHQARAHREVWEQVVAPIADRLVLDHLCRITVCVNPDHLEPVTQAENMRRSAVNGGALYVSPPPPVMCIRGHAYTDENTRINRKGIRECRTCGRDRKRAHRAGQFYPSAWKVATR